MTAYNYYDTLLSWTRRWKPNAPLLLSSTTALCMTVALHQFRRSKTNLDDHHTDGNNTLNVPSYRIDVHFMSKLANKPYLHHGSLVPASQRPTGVPSSLRILAINVPGLRHNGFVGGPPCAIHHGAVYPHGVAPSKMWNSHEIEQKVFVQSLYECMTNSNTVGIQVMEADLQAFNPHHLKPPPPMKQLGRFQLLDAVAKGSPKMTAPLSEQELEAPWHQQAWLEEVEWRISGRVRFGEPMQPASSWVQKWVRGWNYQPTVAPPRLFFWQRRNVDGDDRGGGGGGSTTTASHQPHAVIANGQALREVPHALRWLQHMCQQHHVPLYIIHDSRTWANTHADLGAVLKELRKTVKNTIIAQSLQADTAFHRGRWVGQTETEARWQAQQLLRQTRDTLQQAENARVQKLERDWRALNADELEAKLVERGLIVVDDKDDRSKRSYSSALMAVARKCMDSTRTVVRASASPHPSSPVVATDAPSSPTKAAA